MIPAVKCEPDSLLHVFQQIRAGDDAGAAASMERRVEWQDLASILDAVAKGPRAVLCPFCNSVSVLTPYGDEPRTMTHAIDCPVTLARKIKGLEPNDVTEA